MKNENDMIVIDIDKYVEAANALAEQVEKDIKNDKKISDMTVVKLGRFIAASTALSEHMPANRLQ